VADNLSAIKPRKEIFKRIKPDGGPHFPQIRHGSIRDLAKKKELMDLMTSCNWVCFLRHRDPILPFNQIGKYQNVRFSLEDAPEIATPGFGYGRFIIGLDNEAKGAGQRIVDL
jgi:hypothetical protein